MLYLVLVLASVGDARRGGMMAFSATSTCPPARDDECRRTDVAENDASQPPVAACITHRREYKY